MALGRNSRGRHPGGRQRAITWIAGAVTLVLTGVGLAACGTKIETGSVFQELAYHKLQQPKPPRSRRGIRTEYPRPDGWGPQVDEYYGDDDVHEDRARGFAPGFGARETGDGFEINFNKADLADVVKVILRDSLKLGYTLDPGVQGKVTVSSPRALSKTELLLVLESVLQMNRAALTKDGSIYRIVPAATLGAGGGGAVNYAAERQQLGPGYGISALVLKNVAAPEMLRLLASFVTRPRTLRADANRNVLLIRGTASERANLLDVATTFDVDWLRGQSAGIYRLLYATPDEMIKELTQVFRSNQGGIGEDLIRFEPIKRLNAVLVLTKRGKLLRKAATWIKRLDKTDPLSEGLYVYRVEHTTAKRLAGLLNKMFGGGDTADTPAAAEVAPSQAVSLTVGDSASTSNSGGTSANVGRATDTNRRDEPDTAQPATAGSTSAGKVQIVADDSQNKLLIRSSLRDYKKIVHVLGRLDRPAVQVLINATLAEVRLNRNLRYGVQLFLQETNKAPGGVLGFSNGESLTISPQLPGLNFLVGLPTSPKVILDALSNRTSVRLVSSPSLVVANNETATLQVGDDVPIATRQAVSVTDPAAPIVNSIEFRKTGVILKVTPRINSDGLVTMQIEQEVSAVAPATGATTTSTLTPTISQRRVVSTIAVYSGQMVVLGGLVTEQTNKFANRVPVLERVPVVGDIVGKTDDAGARSELVVFIQPQVIRDASDATLIADELRERLGSLAPDDRRRRKSLQFEQRSWRYEKNGYVPGQPGSGYRDEDRAGRRVRAR